VLAPIQAPGEPEVIILQATEVGGAPPHPPAPTAREGHEVEHDAGDSQLLQLPPPVPTATSLAAGQVPAGMDLILWAATGGDQLTRSQRWTPRHAASCLAASTGT
jgi:hypothetical protein